MYVSRLHTRFLDYIFNAYEIRYPVNMIAQVVL